MRKYFLPAAFLLASSALPAVAAAQHDVPWYIHHVTEQRAELAACNANPGDLAGTPDCVNAEAAQRLAVLNDL